MATSQKPQTPKTVLGKVTDSNGRPLANVKVEIYDVDMREWQPLSDTFTDRQGKYELQWTHDQLSGKGLKEADIAIKVFTKEKNTELFKLSMDEVRFNASEREEINITVKQALPAEVVEFDFLVEKVTFLAGKVAIAELTENKEHQDITFLSKEIEVPAEKIEHLVLAHRLQNLSKIESIFFYALLRKNTLLHNNLAKKPVARLSIGINTELKPLLFDAALLDEKIIEADIKTAIAEKIVSSKIAQNVKRDIENLSQYRQEAEGYYKNEYPKKAIELLTPIFKKGKLEEVNKLFQAHKNDLNVFFEKITDPSFLESKDRTKDAKISIELSKFLGFGSAIIPKVIESKGIKNPEDVRKLAKLNKKDWVKEISSANPEQKDGQIISNAASAVVRKFEKEFPTTAFAAQLEREKSPILQNQDKIVSFFSKHEDFDLSKHNVDLFFKDKKVAIKESDAIKEELKSVQRVFKLTPNYSKTNALRNEKIHSAQSIVAIGETRFVKEIGPKTGLSEKEAKDIFQKASTKHTAAMLMVGDLQDSMSVMDIASFETTSLALKLEAVSKDFPNLKSLFKLVDTCECEHCRSVYSPAAYLVEILQFLGKRTIANVSGNAKSELFTRRPDLGDIDLSCANANTPVKYIDLVCELLENAVAQDPGIDFTGNLSDGADPLTGKISNALLTALQTAKFPVMSKALIHHTESGLISSATLPHYLRDTKLVCKIDFTGVDAVSGKNTYKIYRLRQTLSTAEELAAAPEYVNTAAYNELSTKSFAFKLPFDLNHTEAKAYFNRFDINRADLMRDFQSGAGNPTDTEIATEKLGLTAKEREIIVTPKANLIDQQNYWNVPTQWDTPPVTGSVVDYMKRVDHFLDKTGLTYKQLDLLLKLDFIDKNKNLFVKNLIDLSCDTEEKEIANFDIAALDRIHRFLRLQKKTGWKFEVLDAIISETKLGVGLLDDNCLVKAAQLKAISEKTGIKMEELIGCFGEIPHVVYDEDAPKPLYQQVFLNKAKNGIINEGLLPEKVDGSQLLSPYLGYISTCLQLKQKDLEFLLPLLSDGNLTISNLSYLFAASRLVKKLKLKAEDFAIFIELSGIKFSHSPQEMLDFIKVVEDFKNSPIKLSDVKFLLNHEATNLADREIKDTRIEELLGKLKAEFKNINDKQKSKFDDNLKAVEEHLEVFSNTLSGLENILEEDVKTILKFLDKKWISVSLAKQFIDDKFDKAIERTSINVAIDALDAVPTGSTAEQINLIKAFLDSISVFEISKNKRTFLEQTIATAFKTNPDVVSIVLKYAILKQQVPGTDSISALLFDDFSNSISAVNYPKQYAVIRLLYKMLPAINAFKLSNSELEWYLKNNLSLTWFEFDGIPFDGGQIKIDFSKYVAFTKVVSLAKQFTPVENPLDTENPISFFTIVAMFLPASIATKADLVQMLAFLTGYEKVDLDAIDAQIFAVFALSNYQNIDNVERLLKCAESLRKLSATVTQIVAYIKPVLTAADVNDLRATLKSRYDEDTWLGTLKEIMDAIRPQKRDALVAYLLATNPKIKDKNDLYEYFLVDVEMEACMPSSRIVQAHNSIQLFVQRCLMGLEPNAIANLDSDPEWNQWKWMKNYRVWEANRKVFLYPENWYDVTLTDDKTYLLTEFINEIQQNELTNDTAEEALKKYLEKLDNIAFLEVMATWYDVPTRDMHVFARTKGGDPAIYYYRRFENERYWTPWEKVELDITGDHLLAFKRNNRLHLAWPMFSEEADPNQKATLPKQTNDDGTPNTSEQPIDKPRKKLKIQLAISEYSNKKWQPKRVSKDAILTPKYYSTNKEDFRKDIYYLRYFAIPKIQNFAISEVICFLKPNDKKHTDADSEILCGVFNIAGCKGYPELFYPGSLFKNIETEILLPDFLPDFKDTSLIDERYLEQNQIQPSDDLSVRNGISIFNFSKDYELILNQTPGNFRISYPHQFTIIDLIALIFELLISLINNSKLYVARKQERRQFKIPFGTLLPYFMEDSNHAYVIIPGFYKAEFSGGEFPTLTGLNDAEKRTASNVFQLIEDITNWVKKITKEFRDNPPANTNAAINKIITDADFQKIMMEMSKYEALDFMLNFLVGKIGNDKFDEQVKAQGLIYGEEFKNLYHPLVCALRSILYKDGIPALMKRETQMQKTSFNFETYYKPNPQIVPKSFYKNPDGTLTESFPIEDVDFASDGSYSAYNWDLFFRVPLHIAGSLTKNQRFEEALTWFHYMFNPTGALAGNGVQKYWVTKPFYLNQDTDYLAQRIDNLMYAVSDKSNPNIKELEFAISEWRNKPFRPDVIARFRPVAYQKALLMKYLDNLTEWGDYLFRQDTMESIAQATQMYILADKLLGPKPRIIPPVIKAPYETYNQIAGKLDSFSNALIELENILPDLSVLPEGGAELPPSPITLSMLYFCIPPNDLMMEYWNRIADRLFKIRHCQNIDGVERSLALFAPPIDPGMLVRAAASGLDISAVIAGLNAPTPYYRFNVLAQKATELAQEVRGLGNSLLQALEKKDGEAMALLRSELELKVLNAVKDIKILQINESKEQIEVLKRTKKVTEERHQYYRDIDFMSPLEITALTMNVVSTIAYTIGSIMEITAGASALVPDGVIGASGFGGSPVATLHAFGGEKFSSSVSHFGKSILLASQVLDKIAGGISTVASYQRRNDDWKLQERLANKELDSIEKQISAAEIRKEIAETDFKNHELQIENSKKTDEFMRSKFTNKELYDWMIGQISGVYFKSYQLAHDFAKKAERSYRFELGNDDAYISYGYWDSMKKGLQSADALIHDIKRMETGYLDKNKREYEITKHISLAQLDPLALVRLRATGICDFEVPEVLYDMDFPGQYFRRLKSVSVSLPCIAGPYTSVSAKMSLVNNRYRKNTNEAPSYVEDVATGDNRFVYNIGAIQSIATSNAQNDSGVFELNFRDERYLPFENTGAISSWRLELPTEVRQFDYDTISDVIIHVKYTAREGGSSLKTLANAALIDQLQGLGETGMHIAINMKHDLPNEWHLLKNNGTIDLVIDKTRLPYMAQPFTAEIESVMFIAKVTGNPANFVIKVDANPPTNLSKIDELKLNRGISTSDIKLDTKFTLSVAAADKVKLEELMMVVKYSFTV